MRIDFYTKAVLTAIAIFLGVIALRPWVSPDAVRAQPVRKFEGVQYQRDDQNNQYFFDTQTGEIWTHLYGGGDVVHRKLEALGQPLK